MPARFGFGRAADGGATGSGRQRNGVRCRFPGFRPNPACSAARLPYIASMCLMISLPNCEVLTFVAPVI